MTFIPTHQIPIINGEGPKDCKIAIVGEAAGAYEERQGRPFVGPAGGVLDSCLHTAGLARSEIYITNLVKTKPEGNNIAPWWDGKKGFTEKGREAQLALFEELNSIKANVVVALGGPAIYALTGKLGALKWRGSILPSIENSSGFDRKIIACMHPAATLYGGKKIKSAITGETSVSPYIYRYYISQDLKRARSEGEFSDIILPERKYEVEMDFTQACGWVDYFIKEGLSGKEVACDIEVVNFEVSCISFCSDPSLSVSIPFYYSEGIQAWTHEQESILWKKIADFLSNESITKVWQNGIFDRHFMAYRNGIITRGNNEDTMYAHHIIFPDFHKGLQFLCSVYTKEPYYKDEGKHWSKWIGNEIGFRIYNAKDSAVTLEAWKKIKKMVNDEGYKDTYEFTKRLIDPLIYMMLRGIRVGKKELLETKKQTFERIEEKEKELDAIVGRHLNAQSPKQVQTYFYVELGLEPYYKTTKTATGIKKTVTADDKAMQRFAKGTARRKPMKQAKLIQEIRGLSKLYGTYLNIDFDEDDRFRFSVRPRGTTTGRLSTSKTVFGTGMNVQNLPPAFKTFLIADPGYCLVEIDKRQAEWICVAYMSGDAYMMQIIEEGKDPHTSTAHLMTNLSEALIVQDDKLIGHESDPEVILALRKAPTNLEDFVKGLEEAAFIPRNMSIRQMGKKSNHGLNYDEGIVTFAETNEIFNNESKKIIDMYHSIYPGIRLWHQRVQSQLEENRTIVNPFGRKRRFLDRWGDNLFKQAYAYNPQSTVGDLVNYAICDIYYSKDRDVNRIEMLGQVHDSILFQFPTQHLQSLSRALYKVREFLEIPITASGREFTIPTDAKIGYSWGSMEEIDINTSEQETHRDIERVLGKLSQG